MRNKLIRAVLIILIFIVFAISLILTIDNLSSKTEINQNVNISLTGSVQKINLNTATKEQLELLPGIGEVIAERIIEYRKHKKFESVEELDNIKGIGPEKLKALKDEVSIN